MRPPVAADINRPHRAEVLQVFQALAGRAFAQIQPVKKFVLGQGMRGNEQQAVNLGHGGRLVQRTGKLDEQMDDLHFNRVQGGDLRRPVFHRVPLHGQKYVRSSGLFNRK